jgi:glucan phosphoethanolaminetransferase (alkaline phosphatase superfamily)
MTDEPDATPATPSANDGRLKRRLIIGGLALVTAVISWFVGAAVLPRWWAQRIGDTVDGRITFGSFLGVSAGVLFTLLALLVLWLGFRFRRSWRRAFATLVLAALVASPNLLTLGIVIGDGSAAHAGERILDVDGPGFRGGTLVGAIIGFVLAAMFAYVAGSRRRNKRRVRDLREQASAED